MRNKIFRIIEREMEVTNNKTYQEYLRQLKKFLDKESKNYSKNKCLQKKRLKKKMYNLQTM